jgi:hypothetical protein
VNANQAKTFRGLREPLFATHAIGPDELGARNGDQIWLRAIISQKLNSGPVLAGTMLWFGMAVALYDPFLVCIAVACWVVGLSGPGLRGQLSDPTTLWAAWGNKGEIPEKEFRRFSLVNRARFDRS